MRLAVLKPPVTFRSGTFRGRLGSGVAVDDAAWLTDSFSVTSFSPGSSCNASGAVGTAAHPNANAVIVAANQSLVFIWKCEVGRHRSRRSTGAALNPR